MWMTPISNSLQMLITRMATSLTTELITEIRDLAFALKMVTFDELNALFQAR